MKRRANFSQTKTNSRGETGPLRVTVFMNRFIIIIRIAFATVANTINSTTINDVSNKDES